MSEELEVLKIVCRQLKETGIPYMITGSIAANLYAVPRMTRDIDIVIEVKREDADRILKIFKDDFYIDLESVKEAIEKRDMFNIIHNEYIFKIDFIIRKDSPYRELEFKRQQKIQIEGVEISVVSIEDLILSKLVWARDSLSETQLGDVRNLLETAKDIDMQYLKEWIRSLGLEEIYDKVKK